MTSDEMYHRAERILRDCCHDRGRDCEVDMGHGETLYVCCECWNRHVYARQEARKAQLAEHKATLPTCDRCGKHGANWTYGPFQLCGRCKTRSEKEHWQALAKTGNAAFAGMIAGRPIVDTRTWAMNTNKGAS